MNRANERSAKNPILNNGITKLADVPPVQSWNPRLTSRETMSPIPEELRLDRQARELHVRFDDGAEFVLPCEYLRIFSPSAEVKTARARGDLVTDKQSVNIERIEPYGGTPSVSTSATATTPGSIPGSPCTNWAKTVRRTGNST